MIFYFKENCQENHDKWPIWAEDPYLSGLLTFTKAMAFRWPSWAPRGEYEHFDSIRKLCGWVPQTGFPALFRELWTLRKEFLKSTNFN